jgi:hypothetical protein
LSALSLQAERELIFEAVFISRCFHLERPCRFCSGEAQAASLSFSAACRKVLGLIPTEVSCQTLDDYRQAACAPQTRNARFAAGVNVPATTDHLLTDHHHSGFTASGADAELAAALGSPWA